MVETYYRESDKMMSSDTSDKVCQDLQNVLTLMFLLVTSSHCPIIFSVSHFVDTYNIAKRSEEKCPNYQ
jgi:hypothetical protein